MDGVQGKSTGEPEAEAAKEWLAQESEVKVENKLSQA